jgi:U3 small nucleolar ribonucleoprotein protein IMP4
MQRGKMINRKLKERKEYLKSKELQEIENSKRKELEKSLKNNIPIPHHLRSEAKDILNEIIYEVKDNIDFLPPKIAVSTSHHPSSLLKSFSKHISLIFNGFNLMRGKLTNVQLNEYCLSQNVTHLIILNENKGNPSSLILCKYPFGPTYKFSLYNLKYQRRQKNFGEKVFLICDGLDSEIGEKLKLNMSLCFPKIKEGNRVVSFVNRNGTISFKHFLIEDRKLEKECEFDLKLFKVMNSTFEMEGEDDYTLQAFTNSRKDDILKQE